MARLAFQPAVLMAAAALAAPGLARADTRVWNTDRFEAVSVIGSCDTEIETGGPGWKVVAEGDRKSLDQLRVETNGRSLLIGRKDSDGWSWGWTGGDVRVKVYAPRISSVSVAGSADVKLDNASGAAFASSVAGSGSLKVENVNVGDLAVSVAGSGSLGAKGQCRRLKASVVGSGEARLEKVDCGTLAIEVAGSGAVAARGSSTAAISAVGSGAVRVYGAPRCAISKLGSAQVYCSDQ